MSPRAPDGHWRCRRGADAEQARRPRNFFRPPCARHPPVAARRSSTPTATGSASSKGDTILESRIHPADGLPRPAERRGLRQGRRATSSSSSCPTAAGRSTPAAPFELSVSVKAYFALKLAGHDRRAPYMAAGPRGDPRRRRRRRGATASRGSTSRCSGQIPYDAVPERAAGADAAAALVRRQPLRDVGLDADDRRAAVDHLGASSRCRSSPPSMGIARAVPRRPTWPPLAGPASTQTRLFSWDRLLPRRRPAAEVAASAAAAAAAQAGRRSRPSAGCSSTSRTPTAWGRSSRR